MSNDPVIELRNRLRADLIRNAANIPDELKDIPVFLNWRVTKIDPETGKFNKIPVYAQNGKNRHGEQGSRDDLANLVTFDEALKALKRDKTLAGVGMALLEPFELTALDVDGCVVDGGIPPDIEQLVDITYAEISPSGKGIRAFYLGLSKNGKNHVDGFELFSSTGFVTITGDQVDNTFAQLGMPIQRLTPELREKLETLARSKGKKDAGGAKKADPIVEAFRKAGLYERPFGPGKHSVTCPFESGHSDPDRAPGDGDTVILEAHYNGHDTTIIQCSHASCAGYSQRDFLEAIGVDSLSDVFGAIGQVVKLIRGDSIIPEIIEWLMHGWLALGKLILLAGSPGTGKTTLAMCFAAVVTRGGNWPDGTKCAPGDVVIWSGEDSPSDTLVPRLMACKADLKRVHFVGDTVADLGDTRTFDPAKDMPLLMAEIQKIQGVKLIVVDPVVSAVAGDSHKNAEVRRGLQPLVDLAAKIRAALIGITHFTKGTAGKDTTERVTGSLAFAALARVVMATARDSETGDYLLTRSKSNIGPDGGGWRYKLEQVDVPKFAGLSASQVVWGDALEGSARDLIAEAEGDSRQAKPEDRAAAWLHGLLMVQPTPASEVFELGKAKGFSQRKLQRTLTAIGGVSEKSGYQGKCYWRVPGSIVASTDELESVDDGMEL